MNRVLLFVLVLGALPLAACAGSSDDPKTPVAPATKVTTATIAPPTSTAAAPAVPSRYQPVYDELANTLSAFEATLSRNQPRVDETGGLVSVSLIQANSNLAAAILTPANMASIRKYLDGVKEMGVGAVEIQVSYPVPSDEFPDKEKYFSFYKTVVEEVHSRGMKALIETSCIFANSPFTQVQFDFTNLTADTYFAARTRVILDLATTAKPDFLSFGEEPVNERVFAGIQYTDAQYVAFVNNTARAVRSAAGKPSSVQIGVGTGTWEADLFRKLVEGTDLDFYNIHIYPLQAPLNGLQTAREMATFAKSKGKPVIIGETWLYKQASSEFGSQAGASAPEAFRRDAFTFWEPLEIRYIRDALALGGEFSMPLVSLWGARYFFGQLEWTAEFDSLDFRGTSQRVNPVINQGINSNAPGKLGEDFAELLRR